MKRDFSGFTIDTALDWVWKGFWASLGYYLFKKAVIYLPFL